MSESKILNGKAFKRSLPVVEPQNAAGSPTLKRLLLPQGELAQFFDGEEPIRYLAYIELRSGNARGNHFHKVKAEWIYLLSGEAMLLLEDIETKQQAKLPLKIGDIAFVQTGIAHAIQVLQSGQAIEFSSARFDAQDIYKYPIALRPETK
jgi:hypothetical protein